MNVTNMIFPQLLQMLPINGYEEAIFQVRATVRTIASIGSESWCVPGSMVAVLIIYNALAAPYFENFLSENVEA